MTLSIGIMGANGRMGQLLISAVNADDSLTLAGGIDRDGDAEDLFKRASVIIDFSTPSASLHHAALAARYKKPLLIGTTGLDDAAKASIQNHAIHAPILISANTSLGVNVLLNLVRRAAEILGDDSDIEIFEAHHAKKVDAPSGTALALGQAVADGLNINLSNHKVTAREGHTGVRRKNDIGFSCARGGDVAGDHTVFFYGAGERLELTHRATDRKIFADGALKIAKWLSQKPAGFYTMDDFLSF
jgi:4-hydroxy-tetrahydrodipicolinate reductase